MERLTERWGEGDVRVKERDYVSAAHRLANYEDTGMTPEAVMWTKDALYYAYDNLERFVELAKADKDGRVVVLPCKEGDSVLNLTSADKSVLMKNIRLVVSYEMPGKIIFQMGYDEFANLIANGKIKPVIGESADKE